jgi:hypothetical protein
MELEWGRQWRCRGGRKENERGGESMGMWELDTPPSFSPSFPFLWSVGRKSNVHFYIHPPSSYYYFPLLPSPLGVACRGDLQGQDHYWRSALLHFRLERKREVEGEERERKEGGDSG